MAVRGPGRPKAGAPKQAGPPLSSLEKALLEIGIAKTPKEARALAKALLAALKAAGFRPLKGGDLASQLASQVAAFQRANGLPATGKLDEKTVDALKQSGLWPARGKDAAKVDAKAPLEGTRSLDLGPPKRWGEFTLRPRPGPGHVAEGAGSQPAHQVEHEQAKARVELTKDGAPKDLRALMGALSEHGFLAAGKGKGRLRSQLIQLQAREGLPQTGRLDVETVTRLVQMGVLEPSAKAHAERVRASERGGEASGGKGASERAEETGGPGGQKGGEETGSSSGQTELSPYGRGTDGRDPRGIDEDANAPAGDNDREDPRRGHATLDEGEHEEGHYEIPPLAEQVRAALEEIVRDEEGGGATTYSWDVTFYRPGVYGARQPAEPLWHLVVDKASAFDRVWAAAREALASRMREIEPESPPPTEEDFVRALRRARVRDREG